MQLEFTYWGPGSLRGAVGDYMENCTDGLAEATVRDYEDRGAWLLRELGETTPITSITSATLEQLARRMRGVIANVTIKRRLVYLRAVLKRAQARDLIDRLPALPRLRNDGVARTQLHTVDQWRVFRGYLPPGPFRRLYDVGFWTGMHLGDLFRMQRQHVKPGEHWRVNTKNRRCHPMWFPSEPELDEVAHDFGGGARLDAPITGPLWNVRRTLHMAAHRAIADGHDLPIISVLDLRRSYASMLSGRGYPDEYIRIALGHQGAFIGHPTLGPDGNPVPASRLAAKPTTLQSHYLRPTPDLLRRRVG